MPASPPCTPRGRRTRHAPQRRGGHLFAAVGPLGRTVAFVSALAGGGGLAFAQAQAQQQAQQQAQAQRQAPAAATQVQEAASNAPPLVLPTVEVEGEADGYRSEGSKLPRAGKPLVDTPQVVTVVPEKVMEEQKALTVRDALRNVSGITIAAGEGGRQGDTFILRGFSGQSDMFRDGSRDLGWFTRDTFNLEGVEVFFGPSSVLFGRGSTGGAVNLVTKSPKQGSFAEVGLTGASAPQGRVEADVNHAFNRTAQVRINAMGQMGEVAGREGVEEGRAGLAPSLRLQLGERTVVGADYLYQRERSTPDYGQPFYNGMPVAETLGVPRSAFYGVEGSDKEEVDAHVATARVQHDFNEAARLTSSVRFGRIERLALPTAPRNLTPAMDPTAIGRQRFETDTDNTNLISQTDLRLQGATAFLAHVANLGVELAREHRRQLRYNLLVPGATGAAANINADLRNPDPSPDVSGLERVFASFNRSTMYTAAVYASDQVEVTRGLELLASLRLDSFRTNYRSINTMAVVTPLERDDLILNWRGGLVVHPLAATSVYATVGSSTNPSAEAGTLSEATASLDPERNVIYEAGAKADLLAQRLQLGGSAFRLAKTNARVPGPDPMLQPQILAGKQRVQGFNLGLAGALLPEWKLIGSYTYLRSRLVKHTTAYLVGQRMPNTPAHGLSLWSTYTLFDRLVFGGGAVYQSDMTVNNPTSEMQLHNRVPDYWRFDAFASYAFRKADLQLNVANLTDALYYEQVSGSQAVPAERRVVLLSARLRI
jgi:catecholate siderophore receptor